MLSLQIRKLIPTVFHNRLKDRLSSCALHVTKPCPTYLSKDEESELITQLFTASNIGYVKTRRDVWGSVWNSLIHKGTSKGH